MKAQITAFMLLGIILLVGLMTVLAFVVLVVTGTIADPFVASDVSSYFNSCLDQALQCAVYQQGFDVFNERVQQLAVKFFPLCLQNISEVFRGKSVSLADSAEKNVSVFFADEGIKMSLENAGFVRIGKAAKQLNGLVSEKPVAFSKIAHVARSINPAAAKLSPSDRVISRLDNRYRAYFFQTDAADLVVLRDVESNISYRNPYTVVFEEKALFK